MSKKKQTRELIPTGYAEKEVDCPDWVLANLLLHAEWRHKEAFKAGSIAIEWGVPDSGKWWRFAHRRLES